MPGSDINAINLLENCLKFHPDKRPTLNEIMTNSYFKDYYKPEELEELENAEPIIMELEFE